MELDIVRVVSKITRFSSLESEKNFMISKSCDGLFSIIAILRYFGQNFITVLVPSFSMMTKEKEHQFRWFSSLIKSELRRCKGLMQHLRLSSTETCSWSCLKEVWPASLVHNVYQSVLLIMTHRLRCPKIPFVQRILANCFFSAFEEPNIDCN